MSANFQGEYFTGLNNLKVHTISDVRYDEYFGFTDSDVDELLELYGLSSYKYIIRDWYDGYRFGDLDVYCPWDVINYCDELLAAQDIPPRNYWANTSGNDLILRLLEKADSILTPDRSGIVIELKYANDGNLEAVCAEALKQIEEKKYAEGLKRRGTKKIMKYGIAFCEKECMVVMT